MSVYILSVWPDFVFPHVQYWKDHTVEWLRDFPGPLYPLLYENLLDDLYSELQNVFEFMHLSVNETALKCAVENREGNFHRKKREVTRKDGRSLKINELYSEEMIANITAASNEITNILKTKFGIDWKYSNPEN